jgi:hypothetical protein
MLTNVVNLPLTAGQKAAATRRRNLAIAAGLDPSASPRDLALAAFDREAALPFNEQNWAPVAKAMRKALAALPAAAPTLTPERRRRTAARPAVAAAPSLADYSVAGANWKKLQWPTPKLTVTFADGEVVRAPAVSLAGKAVNLGRGLRMACTLWQGRARRRFKLDGWPAVPEIASCSSDMHLEPIDPAACNAMTAKAREAVEPRAYVGRLRLPGDRADYYRRLRKSLNMPASSAWVIARNEFPPSGDVS